MKKLLLTMALLILGTFVLNMGTVQAQTIQFTGVTYEGGVGPISGAGFNTKVSILGGDLWSFTYSRVGLGGQSSLGTEAVWIYDYEDGGIYGGVLVGASTEFVDDITYIAQASGVMVGYDLSKKFGLAGYGRFRMQIEQKTLYENNFSGGVVLFIRL